MASSGWLRQDIYSEEEEEDEEEGSHSSDEEDSSSSSSKEHLSEADRQVLLQDLVDLHPWHFLLLLFAYFTFSRVVSLSVCHNPVILPGCDVVVVLNL